MRAHRSGFFSSPVARRQAGPKFRKRFHADRRTEHRGPPGEERRFGILLKEAVSKQLQRLNVLHSLYDYKGEYARTERVELGVRDHTGTLILEIDWTLRRGVRGKIADFLWRAAVRGSKAVPRVYLEIEDRVGWNLKPMAERIAHAIRRIAASLDSFAKRFEAGRTLGLALIINRNGEVLLPFWLMRTIGTRARNAIEALLVPAIPAPEPQPEPEPAADRKPRATSPLPFYRLLNRLRAQVASGFKPHPEPAYASAQMRYPMRMPSRGR